MPGKSQSHADGVLNTARGTSLTSWTPFVALFSVKPADDGTGGTELSGNGYARQSITFGAPSNDGASGRQIANSALVTFGPAVTANWSNAVAFGIYDAVSAGALRYVDDLTTPKTVAVGDSAEFAIGALVVKES